MDRDVYVVQSLDVFRKYEMTLNWGRNPSLIGGQNQTLDPQLLIAAKNARFLWLWLDSYHEYNPNLFYYSGSGLPTERILERHPELIHRVDGEFGAVDVFEICPLLYGSYYENWRNQR